MSPMVYFFAGLLIGIVLCGLIYYFFPAKQKISASNYVQQLNQQRKQLAQFKAHQEELEKEKNSLNEQLKVQQQERLEERQNWQKERDDLLLKRAEQESSHLLEQTFTGSQDDQVEQTLHWQEGRQKWLIEKQTVRQELEQLQQEKEVLEASLRQTTERRRQDRDKLRNELMELQQQIAQLQQQNNSLQTDLKTTSQTAENSSVDPPDTASWENELNKRQDAWRRERRILHTQITKTQADKKVLEAKLIEQRVQAEKEKQALEEEIEQLMDRMLKLQLENDTSSG
jgi:hypothetical protein